MRNSSWQLLDLLRRCLHRPRKAEKMGFRWVQSSFFSTLALMMIPLNSSFKTDRRGVSASCLIE
ncbi:hypothetical protein K469DRAFT_324578 [Zopfia rhizophila CBS 207.26]|uniref:Uncharacterized protein n=1 Tax=Zopfia rhizophila CBS 207.26 TaxID=1314779 RepID=A0A6A6DH05_9PEZI|nr:hypothetical protein K469DRAFT_324578 [Zopfia rhizophila CBS 207.26]